MTRPLFRPVMIPDPIEAEELTDTDFGQRRPAAPADQEKDANDE